MKSVTTEQFRKLFADLPERIQEQTRTAYRQFKKDPNHPSLRFKKVHPTLPIYSARISKNYRAIGQLHEGAIVWFWVGSHAEYDRLLSQL
ncbi:MAG: type II toxin-antitoxin system RelE/ParE family toxin [Spirulina sp.]